MFNRIAYAAAHVVSAPERDTDPWNHPAIDWDTTLAFRHHLWRLGFKIAEAMDTSQRGMGLDWAGAQELIARSLAEARTVEGADLACGAGTDHLDPRDARTLDDVIAAYETQLEHIEKHGGRAILMASRALARIARSADDYATVYGRILSQTKDKVVLHWLGDMFDPQLRGYWGSTAFEPALDCTLRIIRENEAKVEGIKISLLEHEKEIALRDRLPDGVLCFTGDDFNYAGLIEGDGARHSHALLGIFDAVAPAASKALAALAAAIGHVQGRDRSDRASLPHDLRSTDPILQGRRRLPRLVERPPVPLHPAGRHAIGARHHPLRRNLPPGRPGQHPRPPRPRHNADAPACCRLRNFVRGRPKAG